MHPKQTTRVGSEKIKEIGRAGDFKQDIIESPVIKCSKEKKDEIFGKADDEMIMVTSTINSPKEIQEVVSMRQIQEGDTSEQQG